MRLIYLSALAILLLSSIIISSPKIDAEIPTEKSVLGTKKLAVSDLPVLVQTKTFPLLSAQGVLAVDLDSGVVLYEKDADRPLLPASTTKIVTALTALDEYDLDEILTIKEPSVQGQKMGLVPGEQISVNDLIQGMLIYSANDAAEVLARQYPQGRDAFIAKMNKKAYELAMYDSLFVNPSGLEDIGHLSTARDLTRAGLVALRHPLISQTVRIEKTKISSADGKIIHQLKNTNDLLGEVEGVMGLKTGWTENARENLVTYIERDNRKVIIALLGSQDRFGETKELIEWVFENYEWQEIKMPVYSTP